MGGVAEGSYAASETITVNGTTKPASCTGTQLVISGVRLTRACQALARALESAAVDAWAPQAVGACP